MHPVRLSLIVAAVLLFAGTVGANPWRNEPGRASYDQPEGFRQGGPPPWAPAHGYRAKHKQKHRNRSHTYKSEEQFDHDDRDLAEAFGILNGTCNRQAIGAVIGGVVGGVAGSKVGRGDGRTAATVAGTVIGVIVGGRVGRAMDEGDEQCTGQVLERAPDWQAVAWWNPDTATRYRTTPTKTYRSDGRYCRDYRIIKATPNRESEQTSGSACRNQDGTWQTLHRVGRR
jgi:surface antigen